MKITWTYYSLHSSMPVIGFIEGLPLGEAKVTLAYSYVVLPQPMCAKDLKPVRGK